MEWVTALFLGIVQGLTEFLPVSSSGHLVIARRLLPGIEIPGVLFEVVVHLGTLGAVLAMFRREVFAMVKALGPGGEEDDRRLILYVLAASVPTAFAGFLLKDFIRSLFQSVGTVGVMLLITGALLYLSEVFARPVADLRTMGWKRAFGVGVAQSFALMPGISRSGSTIAAGRMLGVSGEDAARFSFLISIPAVAGATLLEAREAGPITAEAMNLCLVGGAAAFFTGLGSLSLLMAVVRKSRMRWFALYCWAVGLSVLISGI